MTKKKIATICIVALGVLTLFIISVIHLWNSRNSPTYDPKTCFTQPSFGFPDHNDITIENCIGYFYIEHDNQCSNNTTETKCGDTYIYDTKNFQDVVRKVEKYSIVGDNVYIIGKLAVDYTRYDGKDVVEFLYKENGLSKSIRFNKDETIPRYIVVDSRTTVVSFYNDYSKMPDNTKKIFQELENSK